MRGSQKDIFTYTDKWPNQQGTSVLYVSGVRKVYGTAKQSRLKVAQEPYKHVFATGFDKESAADDVMQHLQHNKIKFKFVKKVPCKDNNIRASFKITVPVSDYEHAFSCNSWPPGIYVLKDQGVGCHLNRTLVVVKSINV